MAENPINQVRLFQGAKENPIALVQLADSNSVLLIHISQMGWKGHNCLLLRSVKLHANYVC